MREICSTENGKLFLLDDMETVQVYVEDVLVHSALCWHNILDIVELYLYFIIDGYVSKRNSDNRLNDLAERYF